MSVITGFTGELRKLRETSVVLANDRKHFKDPYVPSTNWKSGKILVNTISSGETSLLM